MCVHMEGPPPEPETLRGLDAIGICPPSDSRRRPKRAPHARVHGLDTMISYFDTTVYPLACTIIVLNRRHKWKLDTILIT